MGDVGSARYELALLLPCPTIRVLSYSNCQGSTHSICKWIFINLFTFPQISKDFMKAWVWNGSFIPCPMKHNVPIHRHSFLYTLPPDCVWVQIKRDANKAVLTCLERLSLKFTTFPLTVPFSFFTTFPFSAWMFDHFTNLSLSVVLWIEHATY